MIDHDISDLGALTANSPWIYNQIGANLTGLLLCALTPGLWQTVGTRLSARIGVVAFAVFGVGTILDGLVRVDCRAIDGRDAIPLCENTGTSWHATAHAVESVISILAFFIAMFALARAFKKSAPWHDLWVASLAAGIGALVALVVLSIPGAGLGERVASTILFAWVALVSYRLLRIPGSREIVPFLRLQIPEGERGSVPEERSRNEHGSGCSPHEAGTTIRPAPGSGRTGAAWTVDRRRGVTARGRGDVLRASPGVSLWRALWARPRPRLASRERRSERARREWDQRGASAGPRRAVQVA